MISIPKKRIIIRKAIFFLILGLCHGFIQQPSPQASKPKSFSIHEKKTDWIDRSINFYATVSREHKLREKGQLTESNIELTSDVTAKILYFARHKIKTGKLDHAERIYRKHIDDLIQLEEQCVHTQLAVSMLLLTLLLQRKPNHVKETREAFLRFFHIVTMDQDEDEPMKECTCSAKVLQAFALFEMKQGNEKKAFSLAKMATQMDPELEPILRWKQFREVNEYQ